MVRTRVATEMTKNGLRSGPNSAHEAKQLGSDRTPPPKPNTTGNVRDMLERGGRELRHYD